jgi:ABC-type branched-subunit amino acid transport system substrate-binding protein
MRAKHRALCLLFATLLIIVGCAPQATAIPMKIALLAPFEGRYREVGYDALYAARLAISESGMTNIELLATDDGDSPANAADRAAALMNDPQVFAALSLGYAAADGETQAAFGDIPNMLIGDWGTAPIGDQVFLLSVGSMGLPDDSFMFPAVRVLFPNYANSEFISSAAPPDPDFVRRYAATDQFAPPPTPLATLTYDAMRILLQAAQGKTTRSEIASAISSINYTGLNGQISFIAHSWVNPTERTYRIVNGELVLP